MITTSKCVLCNRQHRQPHTNTPSNICPNCTHSARLQLTEILDLYLEAHNCLQPAKGGQHSNSGEPTLGVNIAALDFINGKDILNFLHGWERIIREDLKLTPPAFVKAQPTTQLEIETSTTFHKHHLNWITTQPFSDDYAKELKDLHRQGTIAAQRLIQPVRRINCPGTKDDDQPCLKLLAVDNAELETTIHCTRCKTHWTIGRLVTVAMSDPKATIYLDTEAIAMWSGLQERSVRRICTNKNIRRIGSLYELHDFTKHHAS
jgi:hypothetical protein